MPKSTDRLHCEIAILRILKEEGPQTGGSLDWALDSDFHANTRHAIMGQLRCDKYISVSDTRGLWDLSDESRKVPAHAASVKITKEGEAHLKELCDELSERDAAVTPKEIRATAKHKKNSK